MKCKYQLERVIQLIYDNYYLVFLSKVKRRRRKCNGRKTIFVGMKFNNNWTVHYKSFDCVNIQHNWIILLNGFEYDIVVDVNLWDIIL